MPKSKKEQDSRGFLDTFVLVMGMQMMQYVKCYKKKIKKGECLCTLL